MPLPLRGRWPKGPDEGFRCNSITIRHALPPDDPVEPGDQVLRHLVPVRLVERLMARARVDAGRERVKPAALGGDEARDIGADRIAFAGEDVDRQVLADAREALGASSPGKASRKSIASWLLNAKPQSGSAT